MINNNFNFIDILFYVKIHITDEKFKTNYFCYKYYLLISFYIFLNF